MSFVREVHARVKNEIIVKTNAKELFAPDSYDATFVHHHEHKDWGPAKKLVFVSFVEKQFMKEMNTRTITELSYARNALKRSISSVTVVVKFTLMTHRYGYMTAFICTVFAADIHPHLQSSFILRAAYSETTFRISLPADRFISA